MSLRSRLHSRAPMAHGVAACRPASTSDLRWRSWGATEVTMAGWSKRYSTLDEGLPQQLSCGMVIRSHDDSCRNLRGGIQCLHAEVES